MSANHAEIDFEIDRLRGSCESYRQRIATLEKEKAELEQKLYACAGEKMRMRKSHKALSEIANTELHNDCPSCAYMSRLATTAWEKVKGKS